MKHIVLLKTTVLLQFQYLFPIFIRSYTIFLERMRRVDTVGVDIIMGLRSIRLDLDVPMTYRNIVERRMI